MQVRQPLLEFELRHFQSLTEGMTLAFPYENETFEFKVVECKPATAVCIVDADIETDIIEPAGIEGQVLETAVTSPGVIPRQNTLVMGQEVAGKVVAGAPVVYVLRGSPPLLPNALTVRLSCTSKPASSLTPPMARAQAPAPAPGWMAQ